VLNRYLHQEEKKELKGFIGQNTNEPLSIFFSFTPRTVKARVVFSYENLHPSPFWASLTVLHIPLFANQQDLKGATAKK